MELKLKIKLKDFEKISKSNGDKLIGGFSSSFSNSIDLESIEANNCDSGNCATGCGRGQNIQCNSVSGCGG